MFLVKLSQASMQHARFGDADDECKIDSFLRLLPPRERGYLSRALSGEVQFPTEEIIDLLEDYKVRLLPTACREHLVTGSLRCNRGVRNKAFLVII